jgi:hypothetical protein
VIWNHVPVAVNALEAARLLKAGVVVGAIGEEGGPGVSYYEPTILATETYRGPRDALKKIALAARS